MGWRVVVVNVHSKLTYQNNHLIFKTADQSEMIHLSEIDVLILETTDIILSTMLIKRLLDENILVLFCDEKRLPIAKLLPFYGRHDSSLQLSKQITWNEQTKAEVWTTIISQKILNQRAYLIKIAEKEKADSLSRLHADLKLFDPSNREGHAARIYFNTLFGNKFARTQENDINGGLNYGYSLLLSIFAREIVKSGCMTQFGLKHANQFNDFNLASDLMEPFRPIVDQIVFTYRAEKFSTIKRRLFDMFSNCYAYNNKEMFLTNIASDYTKKIIKVLNGEQVPFPQFSL